MSTVHMCVSVGGHAPKPQTLYRVSHAGMTPARESAGGGAQHLPRLSTCRRVSQYLPIFLPRPHTRENCSTVSSPSSTATSGPPTAAARPPYVGSSSRSQQRAISSISSSFSSSARTPSESGFFFAHERRRSAPPPLPPPEGAGAPGGAGGGAAPSECSMAPFGAMRAVFGAGGAAAARLERASASDSAFDTTDDSAEESLAVFICRALVPLACMPR
mmetsp:Transcript_27007/g.46206  ORF Transcript_27007/g.46206 Transcript_27007/m.46206 type:complete len:217 (-) Transcript_27007:588-1238(-)